MTTIVFNTITKKLTEYIGLSDENAVMFAHAHSLSDYSHDYDKYKHLVTCAEDKFNYSCGLFTTIYQPYKYEGKQNARRRVLSNLNTRRIGKCSRVDSSSCTEIIIKDCSERKENRIVEILI